jgi:uncharacterized membrane protein
VRHLFKRMRPMSGDRSRWIAGILAVSVLLNLFLAGMIFGRITLPGIRPLPAAGALIARARLRDLPTPERMRFAIAMRRHAPDLRAVRAGLRAARQAVESAIAAPDYNREIVQERFADLRQAQAAQQTAQHAALTDALGELDAKSRQAIVGDQKQ